MAAISLCTFLIFLFLQTWVFFSITFIDQRFILIVVYTGFFFDPHFYVVNSLFLSILWFIAHMFSVTTLYAVSLLQKRQVPIGVNQDGLTSSSSDTDRASCESIELSQELIMSNHESEPHVSEHPCGESFPSVDEGCDPSEKQQFGSSVGETGNSSMIMRAGKTKLGTCGSIIKKKKRSDTKCSPQTIRSLFQQYKSISSVNRGDSNMDSPSQVHILRQESGSCDVTEAADSSHITCREANNDSCGSNERVHRCNQDETFIDVSNSFEYEKNNHALLEWQRIQQRMQTSLPLCKGHGEPCVARLVKKPGPNIGRGFYVCPRAKGPASNPDANCGYFKWASVKSRQKKT